MFKAGNDAVQGAQGTCTGIPCTGGALRLNAPSCISTDSGSMALSVLVNSMS
ncbi:hypothetical protein ECZU43_42760 [Escherichia coli]|nr:hypothetical protein ECZU08_01780 [Escherichia coli]GHL10791.1 hypothetical protein ECZU22_46900 [Escherichia coli]GHM20218.1 hypothetical protein ECZU43_42760 [Escherichia coli]